MKTNKTDGPKAQRVLAIVAHPDDEVLGCGGTLALHVDGGAQTSVIIACESWSLRNRTNAASQMAEIKEAAEIIGVNDVRMLGFPDQKLDTLNLVEIITPLEKAVRELRPEVVYCPHGGDLNRDHSLLFQAALVATRPIEEFIQTILAYDTASSTEWAYPRTFNPDTWVDISATLDRKLRAIACYKTELREYPHPRSLEGLRYRAASWGSQVGVPAAETFMTIRRVHRHGQAPV